MHKYVASLLASDEARVNESAGCWEVLQPKATMDRIHKVISRQTSVVVDGVRWTARIYSWGITYTYECHL